MPITSFDDATGRTPGTVAIKAATVCSDASADSATSVGQNRQSHLEAIQQSRNGRQSRMGPLSKKSAATNPHFRDRVTFDSVSRIPKECYVQAKEWCSPKREGAMDAYRCPSVIAGSLVDHKGETA